MPPANTNRKPATNVPPKRSSKGKTRQPHLTNDQIARALEKSAGIAVGAAKILNVDRKTIYRRLQQSHELKALSAEIIERNLDFAESQLLQLIQERNPSAIFFYLKCKGKHRGYIERQEIDQTITDLTPADPPDIIFEFIEAQPVNGNGSTIRAEGNLLPATTESSSS